MAAVFNLNHHATYVHFHIGGGTTPFFVFDMSLSNVILIAVMLAVFVAAIALPFPHTPGAGGQK
ncbi:MAG TPA: hypothetical protein VKR21_00650 [Solirubrobacteraceae bacterium]|nr:hypothetical protein [Solirubrobacteraceae bacterium]